MHFFITKSIIDQHANQGVKVIEIDKTFVVTSLAVDQARQRGVTLKMVEKANCHITMAGQELKSGPDGLQEAVRAAVINRLGFEPDQLDEVITEVLKRINA